MQARLVDMRDVFLIAHAETAEQSLLHRVREADTVKRVDRQDAVRETLDRSELWAVQTPQVLRGEALARALDVPARELARATDDAWLIERAGGRVMVVRGSRIENLKVTTPMDLRVAELLLAERAAAGGDPGQPR